MTERSEYSQGWERGYDAGLESGFSFGYQKAQIEMIQMAGQGSSFDKAKEFIAELRASREEKGKEKQWNTGKR